MMKDGRLSLDVYAASCIGHVRSENEDNFYLSGGTFINRDSGANADYETAGNSGMLMDVYAVCDGMGGEARGDLACRIAIEALSSLHGEYMSGQKCMPAVFVKRFVERANSAIVAKAHELSVERIGTTYAMACIIDNKAFISNIGDSRVYHYSEGALAQISRDHTELQYLVDIGEITQAQAARRNDKHALSKYLGMEVEGELTPFFGRVVDLKAGDVLFLCSDGITDMLYDIELLRLIKKYDNAQEICRVAVESALDLGGYDNTTCVVIRAF